jgi:EAL and modified HD-GYP domain-containing signal transduction protein
LRQRLGGRPITLVAEKVETQEEQKRACAEGFTLFQGYYFCRPTLIKKRKIPANRLAHLQLLEALQHDPLDLNRLSGLVKQDTALAYRFFRLVNSPLCATRREVRSIQAALLVLGDDAIRRIAMLAITTEINAHQTPEVLRMAFVRGRFCELAAGTCGLGEAEQYLLGMFSMLPAMLQVTAADVAPMLPLREPIRQALLGGLGMESSLLRWTESHEQGNWKRCNEIAQLSGLNQDELMRDYTQALVWAETGIHFATRR